MFVTRRIPVFFFVLATFTSGCSRDTSQDTELQPQRVPKFELLRTSAETTNRMPIYVAPYYNAEPLTIDVGSTSDELKSLTSRRADEFCERLVIKWAELPVEVMYVLSIRLYDLGDKDRAVYWFHAATYRARLLKLLAHHADEPALDRIQAFSAFHHLAGEYINGYAFGKLDQLVVTLKSLKHDTEVMPDFQSIYPDIEFAEDELWGSRHRELAASFDQFITYISTKGEQIRSTRERAGIDGKY